MNIPISQCSDKQSTPYYLIIKENLATISLYIFQKKKKSGGGELREQHQTHNNNQRVKLDESKTPMDARPRDREYPRQKH